MSELEWRTEKVRPIKNVSLLSLDKQDNSLNPHRKDAGYLVRSLLVFTTQLSVFIIPFAICTDAGTITNLLILTALIVISTYSISAFEPDNPHIDCNNMDLIKKVLSSFWISVLRNTIFLEYVAYGLLLIFLCAETVSFIAFGKDQDWSYYWMAMGGIMVLYICIIGFNLENRILFLGRWTPLINIGFNGYLMVLCFLYYWTDLQSISIDSQKT